MIEIIPGKNFDDNLWSKYFYLSRGINEKYYPEGYDPDIKISEFRELLLKLSISDDSYIFFLIVNNGIPEAWLDSSVYDNTLYAKFDFITDKVNEELLNAALNKLYQINNETVSSHIELISFRDPLIKFLKSINTPVCEEMHFSKLERKDMDISLYKSLVSGSELNKLNLRYFNEIPADLINEFVDSINNCFKDRDNLAKYHHQYPPLTPEEWYKDKQNLKAMGTKLQILILFDENSKIAGFCWVCIDSYRKKIIRHNDGFTAVNEDYRGKGIGKFLKAKLYIKLLEENKDFEYLTSDTMPWNKYMYKINEEFGFKPYRHGYVFKLTNEIINK